MRRITTIIIALLIMSMQSQAMQKSSLSLREKVALYGECMYKYPTDSLTEGVLVGLFCLFEVLCISQIYEDRMTSPVFYSMFVPAHIFPIMIYGQHQSLTMPKLLFNAIENDDNPLVKKLLDYNVDPNSMQGQNKTTSLMYAAQHKRTDAIESLMRHNADISLQDTVGKTAYDYAQDNTTYVCLENCEQKRQFIQSHGNPILALCNREIGLK